jgi:hypothetical protein
LEDARNGGDGNKSNATADEDGSDDEVPAKTLKSEA